MSGRRATPLQAAQQRLAQSVVAGRATRLQQLQQLFAQAVYGARELDEREFAVFIDFACRVIAREAARNVRWEQRR